MQRHDAVVVGAGPNGLAAAITLARAGRSVVVLEANDTIGGGVRSAALTLPGFTHDLCSAVYATTASSPFFRTLPLEDHGLRWVHPPSLLAHPLDDGTAAVMDRSLDDTARGLGRDGRAYQRFVGALAGDWDELGTSLLQLRRWPRRPLALARVGLTALCSMAGLARRRFSTEAARALLAGMGAHSVVALEKPVTAGAGLVLAAAGHAAGWPFAAGGAQKLAEAFAGVLRAAGGTIETGRRVQSLDDLPPARAVLFDVTPRQLLAIAGERLSRRYRRALERYRYGPGSFKIDYALDGPVPWTAEACRRAGTVHLGGSLDEIATAERQAWEGVVPERPFVLAAQPSLFDPTRAPPGKHVLWAYCHLPHGSDADMTGAIEAQIERFAPGFRGRVLARAVRGPRQLEAGNANIVGGDIAGGASDLGQILGRPMLRLDPYRTGAPGIFLCSSSTPPGGGVHGMCGHLAARSALRWLKKKGATWAPSG
jgi:phytoene dehydrogenase-like protein